MKRPVRRAVIAAGTTLSGIALVLAYGTSVDRLASASTAGRSTTGDAGAANTPGAAASTSTTYDGAAASTRFGDVQVRITVTAGVLTAAEAITYPNANGHDQQINSYAIRILSDEAATAGNANIDLVSGATYTSNGYVQSLQDALDQAGL